LNASSPPSSRRTAIAVSGTPDQVVGALRQVFAETSARGLLVETLSREEARLFAREVIPALQGISFISK
jgi:alkanesulfonate monooxygenase SsuD/methylene tetrahydromethanopterin reductase-like flavin-dependent oxidoreductase (luciferase family)